MTKTKTTKKALFASAMSLILCFAMLLGTTYAWFTDSVTSAGNVIQSGTLDVDLVDAEGKSLAGEVIEFVDMDDNDLWEPGCTYKMEPVYVKNNGNLALKYEIVINGIEGNAKLLEVIEWTVTVDGVTKALADLKGELQAGAMSGAIVLTGHMKEEAGNEYQNLTVEGISVAVYATQLNSENDSFGPDYDKNAFYPEATVAGVAYNTFAEAFDAAIANNETLVLNKNIATDATYTIPANASIVLDLNGNVISASDNKSTGNYELFMLASGGEMTVTGNGTITLTAATDRDWNALSAIFHNRGGELTIESGSFIHNGGTDMAYVVDNSTNWIGNGNKATLNVEGGVLKSSYIGIRNRLDNTANSGIGVINVSGGEIVGSSRAIWTQLSSKPGAAEITVTGGTLTSQNCALDINNDVNSNIAVNISGGTFNGKVKLADANVTLTGYSKVQIDETYVYIVSGTNSIGVSNATEMQAALDNAQDGAKIVLTDDIEGNVTATQKPGVKVTIEGNGYNFAGVLLVDGKSGTYTTAGLTVKDLTFAADSISADACIQLGNGDNNTRYTCNVTIDNCTFDVLDAVGVKSYTGGDKNLVIKNSTATEKAHSLAQLTGVDGVLIENCEIKSVRGMNFNNSTNIKVVDCDIDVEKYAARFGAGSGDPFAAVALIKDCTIKSENGDNDAAIVLRGTASAATLTIENSEIIAKVQIDNSANATVNQ